MKDRKWNHIKCLKPEKAEKQEKCTQKKQNNDNIQKIVSSMVDINPNRSIIILNVNG